jgi:drug/metabolite transporter (DMT)-like permease
MDWFSLALLSALSLASADAFTKKELVGYSGLDMMLIRFAVTGVLLLPLLFVYPLPAVPLEFWGWIVVLVPLELLAMFLYMQAIRDAPLYQTLPYLAFTPVFNILTGWVVLGEQVSLLGGAGIMLVMVGVYLLNIDKVRQNGHQLWFEPLRAIVYQPGSRRMLMVAVIFSLTSVGSKAAMLFVGPMSFAAFYFVTIGLVTLLLAATRPSGLRVLLYKPGWHLFIGVLFALMVVTHFLAMSKVEAAYMVAVKRTSLLFGILYGAWLFNEKGLARHFFSAAIMVAGVALILLV